MKNSTTRRRILLGAALAVFGLGVIVWAVTGAHLGWTQTSTVSLQRDEVTGIDYPVRQEAFVAGVEVPAATTGIAAVLAAITFLPALRRSAVQA